jgi:hypothetical protein
MPGDNKGQHCTLQSHRGIVCFQSDSRVSAAASATPHGRKRQGQVGNPPGESPPAPAIHPHGRCCAARQGAVKRIAAGSLVRTGVFIRSRRRPPPRRRPPQALPPPAHSHSRHAFTPLPQPFSHLLAAAAALRSRTVGRGRWARPLFPTAVVEPRLTNKAVLQLVIVVVRKQVAVVRKQVIASKRSACPASNISQANTEPVKVTTSTT